MGIASWLVSLGIQGGGNVKNELRSVKAEGASLVGVLGSLAKMAGLTGSAISAVHLASVTYGMAEAGAKSRELGDSFRELARQAGSSGDSILASLKKASGGTIAEADLTLSANRAMMLGVSSNAEQMASLMEVARFRARAMGLETSQAFADIVTGLGRMSPLILDNLGIVFDSEAEYAKYAVSLGKSAKELTETEKKQALLNATLREGQTQIKAAGGLMDNTADSFRRTKTAIADAKDALSKWISEWGIWENVAEGVNRLIGKRPETETIGTSMIAAAQAALKRSEAEAEKARQALRRQLAAGTIEQADFWDGLEKVGYAALETSGKLQTTLTALQSLQGGYALGYISETQYKAGLLDLAKDIPLANAELVKLISPLTAGAKAASAYYSELELLADSLTAVGKAAAKIEFPNITGNVLGLAGAGGFTEYMGMIGVEPYQLSPDARAAEDQANAEKLQKADQTAREWQRIWKSAAKQLQDDVRGLFKPTMEFDTKGLLPRKDTWDEDIRRLQDVVNLGDKSPWAQWAKDKGYLDSMLSGKELQTAAAKFIDEFQKGMHPEAVNVKAVTDAYKEQLASKANWENIYGLAESQLAGEGITVDTGILKEAMGQPAAGGAAAMLGGFKDQFKDTTIWADLSNALNVKLGEDNKLLKATGSKAGKAIGQGVKDGLFEVDVVGYLVDIITPRVQARINARRERAGGEAEG